MTACYFRVGVIVGFISFSIAASLPADDMTLIDARKGSYAGQRFGDACEGLGDTNGDGYNDFLTTSRTDQKLYLYLGAPHPFDNPPVITWPNHNYDIFSFSPVNIGDIDCDGVNDFASMFGNWDSLKIFTGLERLDSSEYVIIPPAPYGRWDFTMRIAGGGDNNHDGRPEFWISDYYKSLDTLLGYSGCDLLDTIPDYRIVLSPNPDNQYMTYALPVLNTCDLNGDSIDDIVFSQPARSSDYNGRICIIWGGADFSTSADVVFYAPLPQPANHHFGWDIDCLGDINGDGIDDLWVSQGGRNYIYYGGQPFDTFPDVALDWSYMDIDMENVGDVNNDGWNDVILVDDSYLINRVSYIYSGPDMDTLVDVVYSDFDFYNALHQGSVCCVGIDHSWAGDINGDGMDDILISGRTEDVDANDQGWLFIMSGWNGDPVAADDEVPDLPDDFILNQNYPNPFNSGTTIDFNLPRGGYTELEIFNILGESVAVPLHRHLPAGEHRVTWNGRDASGNPTPTGIYFYRITSGGYSETKKMVVLK